MCGRFAVYSKPLEIAKYFSIKHPFNLEVSYNIAPTENISVICSLNGDNRKISTMRWGLIPGWQETPNLSSGLINARVETIEVKPSFRQAIKKRRCLIIANGFYEWVSIDKKHKQPSFIHTKDDHPFAMAGIWDRWVGENFSIDSCCIITMAANEKLSPLHDRMPAIVKPDVYDRWLSISEEGWDNLPKLITSDRHDDLVFHQVSKKVNSAKYKGEDCIEPFS